MSSIADLTRQASLIFTGTVVEIGASTVPVLAASDNLVVVRVDRGLRVDPVLGELRGKMITVAAVAPKALTVGQKAVFFTNSWIHGRGIAVRELEHVDVNQEQDAAAAVARLPEMHLMDRLHGAELVVAARVARIGTERKVSRERNAAFWAAADLQLERVLLGAPRATTTVYFPTVNRPPWNNAPKFKEGQKGIFILHVPSPAANPSLAVLDPGSLVALDRDDFQPDARLSDIERLVAAVKQERGIR
jgi:hypothetical protein